jgi:pyruvate/2-oxoacid:ferredoxin oxidoreductase alpha subunit
MLAPPEKPDALPDKPVAQEKRRTITLTNARPISFIENDWPVIAEGSYHDEHPSGTEDLKVNFRVRRDKHGRHIVYGTFEYWNARDETDVAVRVGKYLPGIMMEVEPALREVGAEMTKRVLTEYMHRWVTMALDACFASLGPQILV